MKFGYSVKTTEKCFSVVLLILRKVMLIAFDEEERIPHLVLGVLCLTRQKNSRFSVIVVAAAKLALPKIFTGAFARPGTGMDFGLAFVTPWPQTVNLACKHNVVGAREY